MSQKQLTIILNIALIFPAVFLIIFKSHIFFFHLTFIILTFGALYWHLRPFVISSIFWVSATTILLIISINQGHLHAEELVEIPMLTAILIAVFLIVRQRRSAEDALREVNQELEARVSERTADLTQEIIERKQKEQELRELSALNQAILDLMPDLFLFLSHDNKLIDYKVPSKTSPLYAILENVSKNTLIPNLLPADLAKLIKHYMNQALETREVQVFEYEYSTEEKVTYCEIRLIIRGEDEVLAVIRDVTHKLLLDYERRRTSRRLHDGLGQALSFLHLKLAALIEDDFIDKHSLHKNLVLMRNVASESYDMVRDILATLQPANVIDFKTALLKEASKISSIYGFEISITSEGEPRSIAPIIQHQILFIFKEALTNVGKHARADHAAIHIIWKPDSLCISLEDDGRGFDTETVTSDGHYGLSIMQERAREIEADLTVISKPSAGTKITMTFSA